MMLFMKIISSTHDIEQGEHLMNSVLLQNYCLLCHPEGRANSRRFVRPSPFLFRDIDLKLQEVSTRNFVSKYISLCRSAVHKKCNSTLLAFYYSYCLFFLF
jgi:hypothetical protein